MSLPLPLHEMTLEEKLQAMEALWDDLSRNPDSIESPSWHEDVLRERQQRVDSGEASFMDWEQAKAYIRSRAHED
jgi:Putative addiction module component